MKRFNKTKKQQSKTSKNAFVGVMAGVFSCGLFFCLNEHQIFGYQTYFRLLSHFVY